MIVDNRSDASHEGQACRHVQVKMEGLAEPVNGQTQEKKGFESAKQMLNSDGQRNRDICLWFTNPLCLPILSSLTGI